jgi:hypothetical protein
VSLGFDGHVRSFEDADEHAILFAVKNVAAAGDGRSPMKNLRSGMGPTASPMLCSFVSADLRPLAMVAVLVADASA